MSAIIAGLFMPFLGGSYVTISGPAAGLAPVLFVAMTTLGGGDRDVGYPLLLGVICMAGCVQIVLSRLKVARFSALFPSTVVEGMLASIGLLDHRQAIAELDRPTLSSRTSSGGSCESPSQFMQLNPSGVRDRRLLPGDDLCAGGRQGSVDKDRAAAAGRGVRHVVGLGLAVLTRYMIHIPDNPLKDGWCSRISPACSPISADG